MRDKLLERFREARLVDTDSRRIRQGSIFFALRGENVDGNAYAARALDSGSAWAVVDDPAVLVSGDDRYLLVGDVLLALQELAQDWRREFDIPVLGITGSNGKTTTKELLLSVLGQRYRVHGTPGNYNNHLGLPLTLLAMPGDTDFAVIEMGANQPGDIALLCDIAMPTLGLITNIGQSHLERLGDLDGVATEKGALFDYVQKAGGRLYVNAGDERVFALAGKAPDRLNYGTPSSECYARILEQGLDHMRLGISGSSWENALALESHITGEHNAINIAAAVAVAADQGLSRDEISAGIAAYLPADNRNQLIEAGDFTVFLDAYNANPSSMRAAISVFLENDTPGPVLILGDMLELGSEEAALHTELGAWLHRFGPMTFLTVAIGPLMEHLYDGAPEPRLKFASAAEAIESLPEWLEGRETLFVKGSRGMRLETIVAALG